MEDEEFLGIRTGKPVRLIGGEVVISDSERLVALPLSRMLPTQKLRKKLKRKSLNACMWCSRNFQKH